MCYNEIDFLRGKLMKTIRNEKDNYIDKIKDIKDFCTWKSVEKITLGWSSDEKYYIESIDQKKYVLRLSSIERYEQKKKEFDIINQLSHVGFTMSYPVDFGICGNNQFVYMILTYIEGITLENELSHLDENTQYKLGRKAGNILKSIHQLELSSPYQKTYSIIDKKLKQLHKYESSHLRMPGDEKVISFVKENIHLLDKQKPTLQHGDFHPGNLILLDNKDIGVIDFNRWDFADPYEEFYKLGIFSSALSIPFCIGQIESYFDDDIPQSFWRVLAVYVAHAALYSIKWAEPYGQNDIDNMKAIYMMVNEHYQHFDEIIPSWFYPIQSKKT